MGKKAEVKEQAGKTIINELAEAAGTGIGTAKKEFNKSVKSFNKWLDDTLTPGSLTTKQKQQAKNLNKKINKEKDPLKSFADTKDKAVQKTRQKKIDEAKAIADKKKADLKKSKMLLMQTKQKSKQQERLLEEPRFWVEQESLLLIF